MNKKMFLCLELLAWVSILLGVLMLIIYALHWIIQWIGDDNLQALDCLSC